QANNVVILIFDPHAAQEAATSRFRLRSYVEHEAAHIAQEFAANVAEVIVLAVKVRAVGVYHPREADRLIGNFEELLETTQQAGLHALLFFLQIVFAVDGFAHVEASEEVAVFAGNWAKLRIGRQVLQIGLHHRGAVGKHLDETVLTLDEKIHDLV